MSDQALTAIRGEMAAMHVDLSAALLWLFCLPWYALGWVAGLLVRCVLWIVAAMVAGYKRGRGE